MVGAPAQAGSTGAISDASGVDYDAACQVGTSITPPAPNSYASPGGTGCQGVSLYDGSTESTDFSSVQLESVGGDLKATFDTDKNIPAAGSTNINDADLPAANFVGFGLKALFQNPRTQNNRPTSGGCARIGTGVVLDQHGSYKDGYHFFLAFDVSWNGQKWIHSAQIGEFDPSPDGAYFFQELGTNDGSGWVNADPNMTTWSASVSAGGVVTVQSSGHVTRSDSTNCASGIYTEVYASTGDTIVNVKGISFANSTVTLPVTAPLSVLCGPSGGEVCESDLTSVGGLISTSDVTAGNSTAGLANSNITGISSTGGAIGGTDTLGDGPTCPTPTFGGTVPPNPLLQSGPPSAPWDTPPCQIDDDAAGRGSLFSELWDTAYSFTV
jgi:hypothetical protein